VQPPQPPSKLPPNPPVQMNIGKQQVNNHVSDNMDLESLDDISYLSV
jgi:hypothetical protein